MAEKGGRLIAVTLSGDPRDVAASTAAILREFPGTGLLCLSAARRYVATYENALNERNIQGDWVELPTLPGLRLWKVIARVRAMRPLATFIPVLPPAGFARTRLLALAMLLGRPILLSGAANKHLGPAPPGEVRTVRLTMPRCIGLLVASGLELVRQIPYCAWMLFGFLEVERIARRLPPGGVKRPKG